MVLTRLPHRLGALADALASGGQAIVDHPAAARVIASALTEVGLPATAATTPAELAGSRGAIRVITTEKIPHLPGPAISFPTGGDALPAVDDAAIIGDVPDHRGARKMSAALARATAQPLRLHPPARWPRGTLPGGPRLDASLALADFGDPVYGVPLAAACHTDGEFPAFLRDHCESVLSRWRPRQRPEAVACAPWPRGSYRMRHGAYAMSRILSLPYAGSLIGPAAPVSGDDATRVRKLAREVRLDVEKLNVSAIAGRRVLLIGQEWERGWTMSMFSQLLLAAGARSVTGLVLAQRTPWTSPLSPGRPV